MSSPTPSLRDAAGRRALAREACRALFVFGMVGSAAGLVFGWFWIYSAYSSQYNGTHADFSKVGGLAWDMGVVPVIFVGAVYHLVLVFLGFTGYRGRGVAWAFAAAGVSAVLYAGQIIPGAMATGGPDSYVP